MPVKNLDEKELKRLRDEVLEWISGKKKEVGEKAAEIKKPQLIKKAPEIKRILEIKKVEETKKAKPVEFKKPDLIAKPKPQLKEKTRIEKSLRKEEKVLAKIFQRQRPPVFKKSILLSLRITFWFFIFFIFLIFGFGWGLYQYQWPGEIIKTTVRIIPYPAVIVNNKILTYYKFQKEMDSLTRFYQEQAQSDKRIAIPPRSEIKRQVIEMMIKNELMRQLAKKYRVAVTAAELDGQIQEMIKIIGISSLSDLEKMLNKLYGWGIKDFKENVIIFLVMGQKLQRVIILDDDLNQKALEKIKDIRKEATAAGADFSELAKKYSEDATAGIGGDLGYFGKGQMIPEFEEAVFKMNVGDISEIIKTPFGYHLVKLEEKIADSSGNITQVRARQIFLRAKNLEDYLFELKNQAKILQFVSNR